MQLAIQIVVAILMAVTGVSLPVAVLLTVLSPYVCAVLLLAYRSVRGIVNHFFSLGGTTNA